jgi:hypothetical protein
LTTFFAAGASAAMAAPAINIDIPIATTFPHILFFIWILLG